MLSMETRYGSVRVTGNGDGEGVAAGDSIGGGDSKGFCVAEEKGDNVGFFGATGKRSGDSPFGLRLIDASPTRGDSGVTMLREMMRTAGEVGSSK